MNDYFCVLPFYSYEILHPNGPNVHCCRLAPNTQIESVRNSMMQGQRSPACSACWRLEDSGLNSERILHNTAMDFYLNQDIEKIEHDAFIGGYQTRLIKLATSNLCNGTCVTCNSSLSSAWASLENKPIKYQIQNQNKLQEIDFSQIVQLSFVGGEPLLERTNFDILQQIIDTGNINCFVSIVTNGSCSLDKSALDLLRQFKNLNICLSIDGIDRVFEYMRYPLRWNQLVVNIDLFKTLATHVSVSAMISNLNIVYYSQMIDFFHQQNLTYLFKQVEHPGIFSPGNLPPAAKQFVLERNSRHSDHVKAFLSCGSYTPGSWDKLRKEILRQDQLKGIQIQNHLPEISSYINL